MQAEREDCSGGDEWPEREADVAADREERHPAGAALSAHVACELGALRVVGGDTHAGDQDREHRERVRRGDRDKGHRDTRQGDACRQQPEHPAGIRPQAESRLDHRRGDRRGEHERCSHRVRQPEFRLEKREESGKRSLGEIRCEVTGGKRGHRPLVDSGPHGSEPSEGVLTCPRGARSGRGRSATARARSSAGCARAPWPSRHREDAPGRAEALRGVAGGLPQGEDGVREGKTRTERVELRS